MLRLSPHRNPWDYHPATKSEAAALQAVYRGEATEDQQKRAVEFIVGKLCERDEMTYRSEPDGGCGAAFAEGRRFVGNIMVHIIRAPLSKFSEDNPK